MYVAHTKSNYQGTNQIKNIVMKMPENISNLVHHGRETYAVYYGDRFVLKRPLPNSTAEKRDAWLAKQHKTKDAIDAIRAKKNPLYNVPAMEYIHDAEYQILEERAPGEPLTADLYSKLSARQKFEIVNSIASFLVDMNELKPIGAVQKNNIMNELKFSRLDKFIENKMHLWFTREEIYQMANIRDKIGKFEYETRLAWSHADISAKNVIYDAATSRLSFIDFAEADYKFIYRDIFAPLQIELNIYKNIYDVYYKMHNQELYYMPGAKTDAFREIMKHRIMVVFLRRFIKASDDLRITPANKKSADNNLEKLSFMRQQMQNIHNLEQQLSR